MTPSSKTGLYERALALWPRSFCIDWRKSSENAVLTEPYIWDVYEAIEASIDVNDDWGQLAAWSIYQVIHSEAKQAYHRDQSNIDIKSVSFDLFDQAFRSNLEDESWSEERSIYEELPLKS